MTAENPANEIRFYWTIPNIHQLPEPVRSPRISLVPGQGEDWDISIRRETGDAFKFSLTCHAQEGANPIRVKTYSIILKNEISEHDSRSEHVFQRGDEFPLLTGVALPPEEWEEGNKLVFQCTMTTAQDVVRSLDNADDLDIEELRKEFLSLMKYEEFRDVKFKVEDRYFTGRRCVLKYLARNLWVKNHMKEVAHHDLDLGGEIILFADNVFGVVLNSIYSEEVDPSATAATDFMHFYAMAVQYGLPSVCRASTKDIVFFITPGTESRVDNFFEFYHMALSRMDVNAKLVRYCDAFMQGNPRDFELDVRCERYTYANPPGNK